MAADLLDGVFADAVLANLPYVAEGVELPPEITRYEPAGALFAGADGLDVIRRAVAAVAGPTVGLMALEIGPEQAVVVERCCGTRALPRWRSATTWPAWRAWWWARRDLRARRQRRRASSAA